MVKNAICVASMVMMMAVAVLGFGEPDQFGHPNWVEAANLVYTNAARIDPLGYKAKYGWRIGADTSQMFLTLGATFPLSWEPLLGHSALNHSIDMADTPCFQHNSCNGYGVFDRILGIYTCGWSGIAENIAAGTYDPWDLNNVWLCDQSGSACSSDSNAGHREDIMGGSTIIGIGYFVNPNSPYGAYATQDFINGGPCVPYTTPFFAGSHHSDSNVLSFITIFYQGTTSSAPAAPQSVSVVIEGYTYAMFQDLGPAPSQALYNYTTATPASSAACQHYYFTATDYNGTVHRYPDTGFFLTYGQGACQQTYSTTGPATQGGGATAPPTAAPTPAPVTPAPTPAPTPSPTPAAPVSFPTYIGCYVDSSTRDLSYLVNSIPAKNMTIEACEGVCLAKGYAYVGLQYSYQCFCSNSYGTYGQAANTDCNMKCRGNSSEICGAGWRNSIYQIAEAPSKSITESGENNAVRAIASVFVMLCAVISMMM